MTSGRVGDDSRPENRNPTELLDRGSTCLFPRDRISPFTVWSFAPYLDRGEVQELEMPSWLDNQKQNEEQGRVPFGAHAGTKFWYARHYLFFFFLDEMMFLDECSTGT